MKRAEDFYQDYKKSLNTILFAMGLLASLVSCLAYFVLGGKCYIQMNDQLDGEVLNYIYRAKYLFSGDGIIPEFMNGMSKSAMTPPSPIGVLFYKVLPPFSAFAAMHIFVIIVGYAGMFLLVRQVTEDSLVSLLISLVVACLFVYLPFYPVYGLSILGQPLFLWALIRICRTEGHRGWYYLCVLLYGAGSSFALVGFAVVALLFIVWLALWMGGRCGKRVSVRGLGAALLALAGVYGVCNFNLAKEMLGIGSGYATHREEMIVAAISDWKGYFGELFLEGGSYGKSYNTAIVLLAVVILAGYPLLCRLQKKQVSASFKLLAALSGVAVLISAGAILWRVEPIVNLRMEMGGAVKSFQADRIYWLLPVCWYLILALCLQILLTEWKKLWAVRYGIAVAVTVFQCHMVYENSTIYHNLRLMIFPDTYHLMNWEDYYAEDVFAQIDDFIGQDKASYRTVSLGITPAAALYNGFYCLDGYSNLYSLEYKHAFREIMEKELEKLEEVRVYFDTWGNRCYLFTGETGNYMMIAGDNGSTFQHLDLNTGKMYEMGARYLFAAMPIDNAEEMGLTLAREEPFATQDSYYRIWLYRIASAGGE